MDVKRTKNIESLPTFGGSLINYVTMKKDKTSNTYSFVLKIYFLTIQMGRVINFEQRTNKLEPTSKNYQAGMGKGES